MASPVINTREIAEYRRKSGVLPTQAPVMDGPSATPFSGRPTSPPSQAPPTAPFPLPRIVLPAAPPVPAGAEGSLDALLSLSGEAFVAAAYRAVLGRDADPGGLANFAGKLERGELQPLEVLGRLRYSGEGCARGRRVKGLFPRYARLVVEKMPVAGPLFRTLVPERKGRAASPKPAPEEVRLRADLAALAAQHNAMADALERALAELAARDAQRAEAATGMVAQERAERAAAVEAVSKSIEVENRFRGEAIQELIRRTDEERDARGAVIEVLNERIGVSKAEFAGRLDTIVLRQAELAEASRVYGSSLASLDRRILRFEAEAPLPLPASFYAALQNQFRGDGDLVRDRLSVYLPFLEQAGVGTQELPVLDLGCGRGEWLGLLRDRGFSATGVDDSRAAVEVCRRQGLTASLKDALQYLKGIRARSLGALTAFHLLEHLDTGRLLALLAEARRVLAPGGLFVLEMPNPDNLRVAACYFYLDPTHRHPIPKELAQLFLERAGLKVREVLPLNPFPPEEWPTGEGRHADVDRWLYGPRDYGMIAIAPKKTVKHGN